MAAHALLRRAASLSLAVMHQRSQGRTTQHHMFTILQATFQGLERSGWEVVAYAINEQQAQDMAADLCGQAGVVPTLAIDTYGRMVAYES